MESGAVAGGAGAAPAGDEDIAAPAASMETSLRRLLARSDVLAQGLTELGASISHLAMLVRVGCPDLKAVVRAALPSLRTSLLELEASVTKLLCSTTALSHYGWPVRRRAVQPDQDGHLALYFTEEEAGAWAIERQARVLRENVTRSLADVDRMRASIALIEQDLGAVEAAAPAAAPTASG
jgi:hypothetical protein